MYINALAVSFTFRLYLRYEFFTFGRLAYPLTYLDILLNQWNIVLPEKQSGSRIVKALFGFALSPRRGASSGCGYRNGLRQGR